MIPFLLFAAACGSDTSGPAGFSVVGVYTLKTLNGLTLPAKVPGTQLFVDAEQFSLNADGAWSLSVAQRIVTGADTTAVQTEDLGTYSAINGTVTFTETSPGSTTFSGSVTGNTLTVVLQQGTNTYVFQR